jgi:hypothetical protein
MLSAQTAQEITDYAKLSSARIVHLKADNLSPYPFTATLVQNSGSYRRKWWRFYDRTYDLRMLRGLLKANNARLTSFKALGTENPAAGVVYYTAVMTSNEVGRTQYVDSGLTKTAIDNELRKYNAHLTSIQAYQTFGIWELGGESQRGGSPRSPSSVQTLFAVTMDQNIGDEGRKWSYTTNTPPASLATILSQKNAKLIDLTYAGGGNFNAVMEACQANCPAWSWWYGKSFSETMAVGAT